MNVVGIRPHKPFWEVSNEELHRVFAVNLYSTFYLAKAIAQGIQTGPQRSPVNPLIQFNQRISHRAQLGSTLINIKKVG